MRNALLILCAALLMLTPIRAAAQDHDQAAATQSGQATTAKPAEPAPARSGSAIRTRANVKVDVTISDQTGNGPVEKKVVSVIAAEESWGKIRTHTDARPPDGGTMRVALNVDARPWLTTTGAIQLELTVAYNPLGTVGKDAQVLRPTELNQSMTIVLQSGKPMVISQAADPIADRKMIVEVVATILK